ncbi:MAG: CD225/dispanin family protein [Bacteroidales bacterium]|nr:CD225/dispanin family protein [Bacteroidales bacterium]
MELNLETPQSKPQFVLPPHSNKMAMSIICTVFCCLVGGIIAIINSSKSNNLYNNAVMTNDDSLKQSLYMQSEASNKTAQTWITISLVVGIIYVIAVIILAATGVLEELY